MATNTRVAAAWCASTVLITTMQAIFGLGYVIYVWVWEHDRLGLSVGVPPIAGFLLIVFIVVGAPICDMLVGLAFALLRQAPKARSARFVSTWLLAASLPLQALWAFAMDALALFHSERVGGSAFYLALTMAVAWIALGAFLRSKTLAAR